MAVTSVKPLIDRIYEVLVDGHGTKRTLAADDRFQRMPTSKASRDVISVRAKVKPIVEVVVARVTPEPGANRVHTDRQLYRFAISIYRYYYLGYESSPTQLQAAIVRMTNDTMQVAEALEWGGNLDATEAGAETGIASDALRFEGGGLSEVQLGDGRDRLGIYVDEFIAEFDHYTPVP